ncbi:membrane protein FxsA [Pseudomonas sp. ABC1]|uniref:FxsA family protein n=1 Tax=Pseudomonas sp. ABC1 TaxID=2748080 RepID=UPI0015C3D12D|nr:FxsA family protein [Pseudomonas sp. ABC1]QLF94915.1 membrane protein FxsA [Pseudomonas sp. ABC1]
MRIFFLLFLLFPLAELAVLIKVGSSIGVLATILLLILAGMVGVLVLRLAGFATAWRVRERMARGELPEKEMLQGVLLAVAGGLLILPGFISDLIALLILLPFTRRLLLNAFQRRVEAQAQRQRAFADDLRQSRDAGQASGGHKPDVIEGEWERRDT